MSRSRGVDVITGEGLAEAAGGRGGHRRRGHRALARGGRRPRSSSPRPPATCRRPASRPACSGSWSCRSSAATASPAATARRRSPTSRRRSSGPIPARVLRAAQFHEFVAQLMEWGARGDVDLRAEDAHAAGRRPDRRRGARRPGHRRERPAPAAPILEIAGPREESLVEMATLLAARRGDAAPIEAASDPADPDHERVRVAAACCPARTPSSPARRSQEWLDEAA